MSRIVVSYENRVTSSEESDGHMRNDVWNYLTTMRNFVYRRCLYKIYIVHVYMLYKIRPNKNFCCSFLGSDVDSFKRNRVGNETT